MRKRLSVIGNSLGIVIEKPILELLSIDRDTELDITTDGDRLVIAPIREKTKSVLEKSAKKVLTKHSSTFHKLAK
ncbi:MAG: AbrB/MazE/SpoVT family DNA-binding domain-containing protein [bacterium]|nr:AbrB/MazE/SpoVT family DNA-binding domain-containing protein [bacterium]